MRRQPLAALPVAVCLFVFVACGPPDEIPVIDTGGTTSPSNNTPLNNTSPNNTSSNNTSSNNTSSNNTSSNNTSSNNTSPNNPPVGVAADEVDPACIDGQYTETLPNPDVDISAEIAGYSTGDVAGFYDAVLSKRYPFGAELIDGGMQLFDCIGAFARNTSSAEGAIGSMSTVVHECAHGYDLSQGFGTYVISGDQTLSCSVGRETFARSLLSGDDYHALRPPCSAGTGEFGCDRYHHVYLSGRGSDQGFDMVLEETTQYVNSLAVSYAFQDHVQGSVSALDGILTFLWYLERYLRLARLEYPDDYARLTEPCWREAILTVWGRAWWIISVSESNSALGISDDALFQLVRDPDLLQEIQRLRDLEGC